MVDYWIIIEPGFPTLVNLTVPEIHVSISFEEINLGGCFSGRGNNDNDQLQEWFSNQIEFYSLIFRIIVIIPKINDPKYLKFCDFFVWWFLATILVLVKIMEIWHFWEKYAKMGLFMPK